MILFYVALKWNVLSSVTVSSHLLFCDVKSFEGKRLPRRALTICLIGIDVVVMTIVWYYAVKRLIVILRSSGRVVPPLGAGRSPTDEFSNRK